MELLMIRSKLQPESVRDVRTAIDKMVAALHSEQPEDVRYASVLLPDGATLIALVQFENPSSNPLQEVPEYRELLELVEGVRAAPPVVERGTVTASYRLV